MRTLVCVAVSVLLLSIPASEAMAFGQDTGPGIDLWGGLELAPVVGDWAEYKMTATDEKPVTMRISVVGEEDDAYWIETMMTTEDEGVMITKMLVAGDPDDMEDIRRMIVKSGDEPAMEMPVQMMMGGIGEMEEPEAEEPAIEPSDLGVESITVPAGTFDATHWQYSDDENVFDAWISEGVGPYSVIKSSSDEFEMVLLAHGDEAKSMITEEPQEFPMKGFGMPGMGGE